MLVSLMTMTSISVDRLLALSLRLRHRQVVTLKRRYITITILWVGSIHAGTIYFVKPIVTSWLGNIGILLCIVISIFSYSKIFLTLRYNHIQPQERIAQAQSNQATPTTPTVTLKRTYAYTERQYQVHCGYN